ncbi:sulfatase, partial [Pseudomonas sp. GW247-3R2A]
VGQVMATLKQQGLDQNTLVIFTSDNGGANYIGLPDINRPYRGWKATFFEGGVKVPFFMRWPARIKPGTRIAGPVSHFDIFATAGDA